MKFLLSVDEKCCSPSLFVLPIGFSPIILARRFAWRYGWVLAGVVLSHEGERRLRLASFWVTPKRTCLSVICSSVVGQLRWKEHIKKHKKFLIFLIDKLDFISLRKIRNNDRTIEYIIQAADIHFGWTFWGSERQGEIGGSVARSIQATRVDSGYTA